MSQSKGLTRRVGNQRLITGILIYLGLKGRHEGVFIKVFDQKLLEFISVSGNNPRDITPEPWEDVLAYVEESSKG